MKVVLGFVLAFAIVGGFLLLAAIGPGRLSLEHKE
jgi:uncharacterized membrane protein YphA (DoxX/SURF4 family)